MSKWRFFLLMIPLSFGILISTVDGQSASRDSLRRVWTDGDNPASERLDAVYQMSETFGTEEADSSIHYGLGGLELAEAVRNDTFKNMLLYNLGIDYGFAGDFEKAHAVFKEQLAHAIRIGRTNTFRGTMFRISYTYALTNRMDQLESYLDTVIPLMEPLVEDSLTVAMIYKDSYYGFSVSGKYPQSIYGNLKALNLAEKIPGSDVERNELYMELGYDYCMIENTVLAEEYLTKSMHLALEMQDTLSLASNYSTLAQNEIVKKDYDQALTYIDSCLYFSRIINVDPTYDEVYRSRVLIFLDRPDEAISILESILPIFEKGAARSDWASYVCAQLGLAHLRIEDYDKSVFYGQRGLTHAQGLQKETMENYEVLYKAWEALGNNSKAYDAYRNFISYRDSMVNERNVSQVVTMELNNRFAIEKYQDSVANQRLAMQRELAFQLELNQQKNDKNIFIGLGILSLGLAAGLFFRYRRIRRTKRILEEKNITIEAEKEKAKASELAKQRFFTNISHEFRTPLTVIMGMIDNIKGHKIERQLIRRNSENLEQLINELLDLTKLESGTMKMKKQQDDVIHYLRYLTESFYSLAEDRQIWLSFATSEEELTMDYDEEKLQHVVYNLLSNALKFTPPEGVVVLKAKKITEGSSPALEVSVSDSGIGIAAGDIPHIFDRFYQVDNTTTRRGEGSGIGLALTKELVVLMNGRISVESEPNEGTTFYFRLPITNDAPTKRKSTTKSIKNPRTIHPAIEVHASLDGHLHKKTPKHVSEKPLLLIIEDNRDVAFYVRSILDSEYQTLWAEDGQKGIQHAYDTIPDIIISDVMMPEKDGFEVLHTLKNDHRTSHIPIILLTAKADFKSKIEGLERGADAYLAKPFRKEEMFVRLRKLIELRRMLQARFADGKLLDTPADKSTQIENVFMSEVVGYIRRHLAESEFGNAALAQKMNMSESQLHRKLKALTGRSPGGYIRSIRLSFGKDMLTSTDLTVSEVAYDVGFTDPAYFSRSFTREFGHAPSSYRLEVLNKNIEQGDE